MSGITAVIRVREALQTVDDRDSVILPPARPRPFRSCITQRQTVAQAVCSPHQTAACLVPGPVDADRQLYGRGAYQPLGAALHSQGVEHHDGGGQLERPALGKTGLRR